MLIETNLQNLARHVRSLLSCSGVCLFLGCPDPALRHPLLTYLSIPYAPQLKATFTYSSLPGGERVAALCDIALQTGRICCIQHMESQWVEQFPGDLLVAPLERLGAVLGFLICTDTRPAAFGTGECRLLEQYLPMLGCWFEEALRSFAQSGLPEERARVTDLQEQNAFISMVSHDLRVPLMAIKGYVALLQVYGNVDTLDDKNPVAMTAARQRQYLAAVMEQANHLEILIGDLLDISRIQAGHLSLRHTMVDIAQLCQRVIQLVHYRFEQQELERYAIACKIAPGLPAVWADPDRVQQILTNLLENAVKYSPDGGLIEVLACARRPLYSVDMVALAEQQDTSAGETSTVSECKPLTVYITIRDRGIGIPHQQQSSLFEPFSRLEHPSTANVAGIGLGLYIARTLVEAMDGRVILRSREGKGTSVTFTLPTEPSAEVHSTCNRH